MCVFRRKFSRATDPQMILSVLGDGNHDSTACEHCLYQQSGIWFAAIVAFDSFAQPLVFDIAQSANIERGVGPRTLGNDLYHFADPAPSFNQQDVTWP